MDKKFTGFLGIAVLGCATVGSLIASDDLSRTFRTPGESKTFADERGKVKLNPANKFNQKPGETNLPVGKNTPVPTRLGGLRIAEQTNVSDYPLLYGFNYCDLTWQTTTPLPPGIISFQAADNAELVVEKEMPEEGPVAVCYGNGKIYTLHSNLEDDEDYNTYTTSYLNVYDAKTWEKLKTVFFAEHMPDMTAYIRVATYEPSTGKILACTWGDGLEKAFVEIDPETGDFKKIGDMGNFFSQVMFLDNNETIYCISYADDSMNIIDRNTGKPTRVGEVDGIDVFAVAQSAVYDPTKGVAYYVGSNDTYESYLFELDPNTGHCELIRKMPGGEHILGLYMLEVEDDAPAAPSDIRYEDGNVCFTAPVKTYLTDQDLTGSLDVMITIDNDETVEATANPGESVSVPVSLKGGKHYLKLRVGNDAGYSPERRIETFIGLDLPSAVNDLELIITGGNVFNLSWNAPTTSVNGAAIPEEDLNYTVIRYPDEVVMAEGLKETTFNESVPEAHARYYYEVVSYALDRQGESAFSNKVTAGEFWISPFIERFDTQDDFDSFKVIDANNDLATWSFMLPVNSESGSAYLMGNGTPDVDTGIYDGNGNDDYLISPFAKLEAGIDYRLQFDVLDQWYWWEHLTILLGKERDVKGNEQVIFSENVGPGHYSFIFNVENDGNYAFLFHGDSPAQSVNLTLDNIKFDIYATYQGPDCVTDVTLTAGDLGALENKLQFKAPTKNYKGENIATLDEIRIYRNDSRQPVKVFENPTPGQRLNWTDTDVEQGMVSYRILPFNSEGQGKEYLIENWVGFDEPADVSNLRISRNEKGEAVVTFTKPSGRGKHGGYVDYSKVGYALFRYYEIFWMSDWRQVTDILISDTLIDETDIVTYPQQYVDYIVLAVNETGFSDGAGIGIVLGDPYPTPYNESFPEGYSTLDPWTLFANTYYYAWNMATGDGLPVKPQDNDGGMLQYSVIDQDSFDQVLSGPRISTSEKDLEYSFFMYHGYEAEPEDLELIVYLNYDDKGWNEAGRVAYNNGASGWARHSFPIDNDSKDVQIAFGANAVDASASLYIDNISISKGNAVNMAVVSAAMSSKRVNPGEDVSLTAFVSNYGTQSQNDIEIQLMLNGQVIDSATIDAIAPNEIKNVTFPIATNQSMAGNTYSYIVNISADGDADESDNVSSPVALSVKGSILPVPENLISSAEGSTVTLSWDKPSKSEINDAVTEDFDSYESFIIDNIGDWEVYDGDGAVTVYFGGPEIPYAFEPKAWQIWAPEEAGFNIETFDVLTPHSGNKYLTAWAASNGIDATLPNDDWLISSEIVGGSEVSFWYRMPNAGSDPQKFEMLYSTTTREPEDFIAFDSDEISFGTDWVYFEYSLPKNAKYFAIRSCARGNYTVALLDDITYTPLYGSTTPVTLLGYNVYRDNELIASNVSATSFNDNITEGKGYTYNVTAIWNQGESIFSNPAAINGGGAGVDVIDGNMISIRSMKGMVEITGAEGNKIDICNLSGIRVAESADGSQTQFYLNEGIYIIRIGDKVFKIRVK